MDKAYIQQIIEQKLLVSRDMLDYIIENGNVTIDDINDLKNSIKHTYNTLTEIVDFLENNKSKFNESHISIIENMKKLYKDYQDDLSIQIIGLSDKNDKIKTFIDKYTKYDEYGINKVNFFTHLKKDEDNFYNALKQVVKKLS